MTDTRCPKCGSSTREGFLLDRGHNNRARVASWLEGPVERWWWGSLKLRGHRRFAISVRRCNRCGFLESYALDEAP